MATVLNVLLPGRDKLSFVEAFNQWLARGTALPTALPGYMHAVSEFFRWPDGPLPAAALIRQSVAGDAGTAWWGFLLRVIGVMAARILPGYSPN